MRKVTSMFAATLWLAACSGPGTAPPGGGVPAKTEASVVRVTGTITYRQCVALPPSAEVKVQLADVSRADAAAVVIGEQVIATGGRQVPFAFEIAYDPARIDPRYIHAVRARIEDGSRLLFISDQRHAVITRGAPSHVDMVLRQVSGPSPN